MIYITDIDIDKESVYRYLGYKELSSVNQRVVLEVKKCLKEAETALKPAVVYDEIPIRYDEENQIIFLNGQQQLTGSYVLKNTAHCDSIIMAISTIGEKLEEKIKESLEEKDTLKGLLLDAIGSAALMELNNKFWLYLVKKVKERGLGLSNPVSPGDNDFPLEQQRVIFNLLDVSEIGVVLNETYVMKPLKSLSMIYGLRNDGSISRESHNCRECNLKDCMLRQERMT